jgi:hypothetical protein
MSLTLSEDFRQWFERDFLLTRKLWSPIIHSENKIQWAKFKRIEDVALLLLENSDKSVSDLRRLVALTYFVNMRTASDYLNYAKMLIEEFQAFKTRPKPKPHVLTGEEKKRNEELEKQIRKEVFEDYGVDFDSDPFEDIDHSPTSLQT